MEKSGGVLDFEEVKADQPLVHSLYLHIVYHYPCVDGAYALLGVHFFTKQLKAQAKGTGLRVKQRFYPRKNESPFEFKMLLNEIESADSSTAKTHITRHVVITLDTFIAECREQLLTLNQKQNVFVLVVDHHITNYELLQREKLYKMNLDWREEASVEALSGLFEPRGDLSSFSVAKASLAGDSACCEGEGSKALFGLCYSIENSAAMISLNLFKALSLRMSSQFFPEDFDVPAMQKVKFLNPPSY